MTVFMAILPVQTFATDKCDFPYQHIADCMLKNQGYESTRIESFQVSLNINAIKNTCNHIHNNRKILGLYMIISVLVVGHQ
jgi:hypothetical protein